MSEATFQDEVVQVIKVYEKGINHTATRTWKMIDDLGHVEALSRLVVSSELQKGFKALRDRGELDKTFEAVVVRNKEFFKPHIIEAAQWRLDNPYKLL